MTTSSFEQLSVSNEGLALQHSELIPQTLESLAALQEYLEILLAKSPVCEEELPN